MSTPINGGAVVTADTTSAADVVVDEAVTTPQPVESSADNMPAGI